ncbi:MG2 domain-containing protein [Rubripirellula amarantea]|nr:MG2 domain-containing protein [Rubripirellula amarantea]
MTDAERQRLLNQLLELHFDLLDEPDASALRSRIEREPEVALLWQQTQRISDGLAQASRVDDPVAIVNVAGQRLAKPYQKRPLVAAALAACLGWLILAAGHLASRPAGPPMPIAIKARVDTQPDSSFAVNVQASPVAGTTTDFLVTPATLSFSVLNHRSVLFSGVVKTDVEGSVRIELPDQMVIPAETRLRIQAKQDSERSPSGTIEIPLPPTRCVTYLTTDRPLYAPGETVYVRSVTMTRVRQTAVVEVPIRYSLLRPDGPQVHSEVHEGVTQHGVGNTAFVLPADLDPGSYRVVAESLDGLFPSEQIPIEVKAFKRVTMAKSVLFDRRSYRPGEMVSATIRIKDLAGAPQMGARVTVQAIAGKSVLHRASGRSGDDGEFECLFRLPRSLMSDKARLSLEVAVGKVRESRSFPIPLVQGNPRVQFFPEGGELVAGLTNRVYVQTLDNSGAPVEISGEIVDEAESVVAAFTTNRDGRARFEITPALGKTYQWRSPTNDDAVSLPTAVADLPVIDTGKGVFGAHKPIEMVLRSLRSRAVVVHAVCRGRLLTRQNVLLHEGDNPISLEIPTDAAGVVRLTVFDDTDRPVMERLVYRKSQGTLKVSMNPILGEGSRRFRVQVSDPSGALSRAVVGVSVVNEEVAVQANRPRMTMPTFFRLGSEITNPEALENGDFYLSDQPESEVALDLLLATQGWRRFAWRGEGAMTSVNQKDLRERIVRLLSINGEGERQGVYTTDDEAKIQAWDEHLKASHESFRRMLVGGSIWTLIVFLLGSVWTWARHRRRWPRSVALLMVVVALAVPGCGQSQSTVITPSADYDTPSAVLPNTDVQDSPSTPSIMPDENEQATIEILQSLLLNGNSEAGFASQSITREKLQEMMVRRGLTPDTMADDLLAELRFPIRQYAYTAIEESANEGSVPATLFWNPMLITADDGSAIIEFDVPDTVERLRWHIDVHASDGALGTWNSVRAVDPQMRPNRDLAD